MFTTNIACVRTVHVSFYNNVTISAQCHITILQSPFIKRRKIQYLYILNNEPQYTKTENEWTVLRVSV